MNTKTILLSLLILMAIMITAALLFPQGLQSFLYRPSMYRHILFVHIAAATLFFANAVIGMVWEIRSLTTRKREIILHTYRTVSWLDARISTVLIILSVISGIMLSVLKGNMWEIGWLSLSLVLFLFSGVVWIASDIPTQYTLKKRLEQSDPQDPDLPEHVMNLLKLRLWISLGGVIPLLVVFLLMVYKPDLRPVALWFQ
ncbi:DUF2269 family protein [Salinispira pacifica]|uniref:DUF2269 family protein n=1 Tax=Salinispira pacifica TaxID=1307761 RepID=V5WEC6_9SPIO|nr:DUF2269 family protein [Salinispira pacifica]AHC13990.1 hypothetical protein L21SP2_0558 [Salinispira pacifica]